MLRSEALFLHGEGFGALNPKTTVVSRSPISVSNPSS